MCVAVLLRNHIVVLCVVLLLVCLSCVFVFDCAVCVFFVATLLSCVFNVMLFVLVRRQCFVVLREMLFACVLVTGLSFCVVCCNVLCVFGCVVCVCCGVVCVCFL